MSFDLKLHAYRLLMDEPFFAALSRKIEKRADYSIPTCLLYTSPSPRDAHESRMPSSA